MKSNRVLLYLLVVAVLGMVSCSDKPNFMENEVVFYAEFGKGLNQIGGNFDSITNLMMMRSDVLFEDYIDYPNSFQLFRNKLYVADKYNRRISIFPATGKAKTNFAIPYKGDGYEFGIPFQVLINKYEEIYVLASVSTNLLGYSADISDSPDARKQFYIYKFSSDRKFIYALGENGIHSEPIEYPQKLSIDLFGNIYAAFKTVDMYGAESWIVKRFSSSGELNFEFNTQYISSTNQVGENTYIGKISDVYNLKNDERLLLYSENVIYKRKDKEIKIPDEFFHSLDVYSILQNAIITNLFRSKTYLDGILGITRDDIVVLYSYDDKYKGVRFRFIDVLGKGIGQEEVFYAPQLGGPYRIGDYFIDEAGDIYSSVIKNNNVFIILRWKKTITKVPS